jgi:microcystin-dependent protein
VPLGAGASVTGTSYELGSTGGQETVKLAVAQFPAHSHQARANKTASTTKNPAGAVPAVGGAYAATQNANMSAAMVAKSGGGQAHENRQPYLSLNYIIALVGIFPAQS